MKRLFYIVLAVTLIAVSVNLFLGPHNIAAGGLTGLSIILEAAFGWDRSIIVFVFNMGILVLTYIFLGKNVFFNTAIGGTLLPIIMGIVPQATLVNDVMLSVIIGSAIFGAGVAILYKNNASSGGTAVPPLILKKYFNIDTSIGLFITDCIVVVLSLFVFDVESFFFAIFSIFLTSVTMRYIEDGTDKKKMVFIISDKQDAILNDLLTVIKRGVTVIPALGGHTKQERDMLMITLNTKDYQQLLNIVDSHDEKAFMITSTVSDVHGLGFSYESASV